MWAQPAIVPLRTRVRVRPEHPQDVGVAVQFHLAGWSAGLAVLHGHLFAVGRAAFDPESHVHACPTRRSGPWLREGPAVHGEDGGAGLQGCLAPPGAQRPVEASLPLVADQQLSPSLTANRVTGVSVGCVPGSGSWLHTVQLRSKTWRRFWPLASWSSRT